MSCEVDFHPIRVIDKESLRELAEIYKKNSQETDFPVNFCTRVSMMIGSLGFQPRDGYFSVDNPISAYGNFFSVGHSWNIDGEGKIIDMTLAQFNEGLNMPVRKGILIISPDDPLYTRYEDKSEQFRSPL